MEEIWKPIPGFPGYEVSNLGIVRSYRCQSGGLRSTPHALSPSRSYYLSLSLRLDGEDHRFVVHTLVMLAFVGPRPDGMEIIHKDGDPCNNALTNLEYGTSEMRGIVARKRNIKKRKEIRDRITEIIENDPLMLLKDVAKVAGVSTGWLGWFLAKPHNRWLRDLRAEVKEERVVLIREMYADDWSIKEISVVTGLSISSVSRIARGERSLCYGGPVSPPRHRYKESDK